MFGLSEKDINMVLEALKSFPEIEEAILFGNRALGNYKKGSDVDLAIKGVSIKRETVLGLSDLLNEVYPLPYFFEIIHYDTIRNSELIKHINNYGIKLEKGIKPSVNSSEETGASSGYKTDFVQHGLKHGR